MKKKIFHFITRYIQGGADENTYLTVTRLDKKKCDITLGYGVEFDKEKVERTQESGVKTACFHSMRHFGLLSAMIAVLKLSEFLKRGRYDLIHTHSTEAGIIGRVAAKLAHVPAIVHTVHGVPFSPSRSWFLNKCVLFCEKTCARFTDVIITNADAIREDYLSRGIGKREQYKTVYSGIDVEEYEGINEDQKKAVKEEIQKKSVMKNPRIILMVSRLTEGKGFDVLLKAAQKVVQKEKNVLFVIVGEGEFRKELERMITAFDLEKHVLLLGERKDVPVLFHTAEIVVLPSRLEGTPRVIFEAMAASKPVLATRVAGIPEQVIDGETGFLFEVDDINAFSDKILLLLRDVSMAQRMGRTGEKRACQFTAKEMVKNIDEIYSTLLEK